MTDDTHGAVTPSGLNHLVLNVRNIEESHRFWTEILGFRQVGEVPARLGGLRRGAMRFYSGERSGKLHHHDVALVDTPDLPPPGEGPTPIGHVAIALPDRSRGCGSSRSCSPAASSSNAGSSMV